jgi:myo-inositol 2-dehydrogenase/D-chiro-inositol 1-dehydrogenase
MESNKCRISIIGAGRMGAIRAQKVYCNTRADLVFVVDVWEEGGKKLADKYGAVYLPNIDVLIKDHCSEVDVIWISTGTPYHLKLIQKAAAAGLQIVTEKPVCESLDDISLAFDAAEKANVSLMCSFQRRFDSSYYTLAKKVKSGVMGKPQSIRIVFRDHPIPNIEFLKTGGDPFTDLAPHDVDFIRTIIDDDDKPVEIWATGSSFNEELKACGVLDSAMIVIRYASGVLVNMDLSRYASYGYDQRIEVFCDKGMVSVENPPKTSVVTSSEEGISSDVAMYTFVQRFNEAFEAEVENVVKHVMDEMPWPVTREDCYETQRIVLLAKQSYDIKQSISY